MDYVIRAANSADIPHIKQIMLRLAEFELPPKREPKHFYTGDLELLDEWVDGIAPNVFVHVAERKGRILGVTMVTMGEEYFDHSPSAHLEVAAVSRDGDGRGIGKALIANAEREAQARGARSMSLHVVRNNARARHVYKQLGYEEELIRSIKHFDD